MIKHNLQNPDYEDLCRSWKNFLSRHEPSAVTDLEIIYDRPCPWFVDRERRKFRIYFGDAVYRKIKTGLSNEIISRALGAGKLGKNVLDLSAGLGIDAVFLAQLGFSVHALERSPLIFLALENAHRHLDAIYKNQLTFEFADAVRFLETSKQSFDVCYFDPMFPGKKKSALPKQEMLMFKQLVGDDHDAGRVLEMAVRSLKFKRCVVKRPLAADPLETGTLRPAGAIKGKVIRYDIYAT